MIKDIINEIEIELLADALYYSMLNVIIVPMPGMCRLFAIMNNHKVIVENHDNLFKAKMSFFNQYRDRLMAIAARKRFGTTWLTVPVEADWLMELIGLQEFGFLMNQYKAS